MSASHFGRIPCWDRQKWRRILHKSLDHFCVYISTWEKFNLMLDEVLFAWTEIFIDTKVVRGWKKRKKKKKQKAVTFVKIYLLCVWALRKSFSSLQIKKNSNLSDFAKVHDGCADGWRRLYCWLCCCYLSFKRQFLYVKKIKRNFLKSISHPGRKRKDICDPFNFPLSSLKIDFSLYNSFCLSEWILFDGRGKKLHHDISDSSSNCELQLNLHFTVLESSSCYNSFKKFISKYYETSSLTSITLKYFPLFNCTFTTQNEGKRH